MIVIVSFLLTFCIGRYNSGLIGNKTYSVVSTLNPAVEILKIADSEEDKEEINAMNRVIHIEYVYENLNVQGVSMYWDGNLMREYTDDDYSEYLKAYAKLLIKYPRTALKTMWEYFVKSSGVMVRKDGTTYQTLNTANTLQLFHTETRQGAVWNDIKLPFKKPILGEEIRNKVILKLSCFDENLKVKPLYYIFWNLWIPLGLVTVSLIYLLLKKEWINSALIVAVLGKIIIIFISAVATYLMYFLSVYLLSYFFAMMTLTKVINKERRGRQ